MERLERELVAHAERPLRSARSARRRNVTGIVTDTHGISGLLHEHGALAFWDFAAAAPYVDIEMTPRCDVHPRAYKDAVFLSPHKFIGGPGTPGVLVARRELLTNTVPDVRRRRDRRLRQPRRARLPLRPGPPRGGRHPGDHRVDPRRAGLPAQGGRRRRRHPGARGATSCAVPSPPGTRTRPSRCWATSTPSGSRSCRSSCAVPAAATSTTTSSSRSSTTCSASSPAAAARAPAPTATGCSASTSSARHEFEREITARLRGHQARLGARELQLLRQRSRRSATSSRRSRLVADDGWRAAAATIASTRRPGAGSTATARSSLRCD